MASCKTKIKRIDDDACTRDDRDWAQSWQQSVLWLLCTRRRFRRIRISGISRRCCAANCRKGTPTTDFAALRIVKDTETSANDYIVVSRATEEYVRRYTHRTVCPGRPTPTVCAGRSAGGLATSASGYRSCRASRRRPWAAA